jgi:hypothetical protein
MPALAIGAAFLTSFNASPALPAGTVLTTGPALTAGTEQSISAAFTTSFATTAPKLSGRKSQVAAAFFTSFTTTSPGLVGKGVKVAAAFNTSFNASPNLTGASDTHGLSICDVVSNVLGMWGIFCRKSAPQFALDRAIADVNHALQLVWNNADGRNYWTNATVTVTLDDSESSADLDDDIQNVVGPCRVSTTKQPLTSIGSIGELETFSDIYLGGAADIPVAYHVERLAQIGGDPAKCVFHVNQPIVGASVSFLLEVVKEAPRFTTADLASCPVVPIPHRYVESLLLPVARYQASGFYMFRQDALKPTIDREYQQAAIQLGLADPLPGDSGDNKKGADA